MRPSEKNRLTSWIISEIHESGIQKKQPVRLLFVYKGIRQESVQFLRIIFNLDFLNAADGPAGNDHGGVLTADS